MNMYYQFLFYVSTNLSSTTFKKFFLKRQEGNIPSYPPLQVHIHLTLNLKKKSIYI